VTKQARAILQIDFDGTLVKGDASTGILSRFAGGEWSQRVNAASASLIADPDSAVLIDTMCAGFQQLGTDYDAYLAFVRANHPPRPGLLALVETAEDLRFECHIVSNGFEFYIRDHLKTAGVEGRVEVHTGSATGQTLSYAGPDGLPVSTRFKERWADHFASSGMPVFYVGDGTSDIAAAVKCTVVFARDSLLTGLHGRYEGIVLPFDNLLDVVKGLRGLQHD